VITKQTLIVTCRTVTRHVKRFCTDYCT